MSLAKVLELPVELQLEVLDNFTALSLTNLLVSNRYLSTLASCSITSRINNIISNNESIFFSIFSPQNKDRLIETYKTVCVSNCSSQLSTPSLPKSLNNEPVDMDQVSHRLSRLENNSSNYSRLQPKIFHTLYQEPDDQYVTTFNLGNLECTRDPLKLKQSETFVDNNIDTKSSILHLIVNEDEPFIKLQIEMKLKGKDGMKSLLKFNSKINQIDDQVSVYGSLKSKDDMISIEYLLKKCGEMPSRSGYDFDVFHKYEIEFGNISVKNSYFLCRIEEQLT